MKEMNPYLIFDGNCREAMKFYEKCFGGELVMMPFSEGPEKNYPPGAKDRVMHARLTSGGAVLMASDNMPGMPFSVGNNAFISINCNSKDEVDKVFSSLGEKGKVGMPLADTFWGAYFGMLTDQFNINWMISCELPKK